MNQISTELVWKQFSARLQAFIRSRIKSAADAEDLLQEVFVKIHGNLVQLKDEKRLIPWLYTVTRNVIHDFYRKKSRYTGKELTFDLPAPSSHSAAENVSMETCLEPFIDQLPEKYKKALIFCDIEGKSQIQLSEELGISYSGAKSRLQRARLLLKKQFNECCAVVSDKYGNIVEHNCKKACSCAA